MQEAYNIDSDSDEEEEDETEISPNAKTATWHLNDIEKVDYFLVCF